MDENMQVVNPVQALVTKDDMYVQFHGFDLKRRENYQVYIISHLLSWR